MDKYLLVMVPWDTYFRNNEISCFLDTHGKCMDVPGFGDDEKYQKFFFEEFQADQIYDAIVVYVAEEPTIRENVVVGWYRHATCYQQAQYDAHADQLYQVICEVEDAFLLPVEDRKHVITAEFSDYHIPSETDMTALKNYMEASEKNIEPLNIHLSIADKDLQKRATPEYQKELIRRFAETTDYELLPQIYGYADEWTKREPTEFFAWDYKGYALLQLFWPQQALACFEHALKLNPDNLNTLVDKGYCLIRLKLYKKAIEYYNDVLLRYPNDDSIKVALSDAYLYAGFIDLSYRWLKAVQDEEMKKMIEPRVAEIEQDMPYLLNDSQKDFVLDAYPVFITFDKETLPEIYEDNFGLKRYIDPVRQKGIPVTPEETVRQKVISYLCNQKGFPIENLLVEESLSHIDKGLRDRVDILVQHSEKKKTRNLLVVECKAPGNPLDGDATTQIIRYNNILQAPFLLLTDGTISHIYYFDKTKRAYKALSTLPTYSEMCHKVNIQPVSLSKIIWKRPPFEKLDDPKFIAKYRSEGDYLGKDTPGELASIALNLAFCLLDDSERVNCPLPIPGCKIIKDYGVKPMSTGNAGGGEFYGNYRWLGVEDRLGKRQNVYLAVFATMKTENDPQWGTLKGKTYFCLAIEERGKAVPRLQIDLGIYLKPHDKGYRLTHSGVRSRGKVEPLINFISGTVPELLGKEERIDLGWLDGSKNISLQDNQAAEVIGKAVSYLLLRSELMKKEKKAMHRKNK